MKSRDRLIISILVVALVLVVGLALYFYKNPVVNNTAKDGSENLVTDDNNVKNEDFTDFIQLSLKDNETKEVTVNGTNLSFRLENDTVYLNNTKISVSDHDIDAVSNNVIVTNRMILIVKAVGQIGTIYSFYDLDGKEIKFVGDSGQYRELKVEDGKLKVKPFLLYHQWMYGYRIENLLTIKDSTDDCSYSRLKDYPEIVEKHKNDVLNADYYFSLSDNEVSLKYDKVLLTVGELDLNTCVMEAE